MAPETTRTSAFPPAVIAMSGAESTRRPGLPVLDSRMTPSIARSSAPLHVDAQAESTELTYTIDGDRSKPPRFGKKTRGTPAVRPSSRLKVQPAGTPNVNEYWLAATMSGGTARCAWVRPAPD